MRTGIKTSLAVLGLFNCFVNVACGVRPEGSDCVIAGKPGVCKVISDCASAWINLTCHNVKPREEDVCCFAKTHKVVCCPKTDPAVFTSDCRRIGTARSGEGQSYALTKSKQTCKEYTDAVSLLRPAQHGASVSQHLDRFARSLASRQADDLDDEYGDYFVDPRITNGTLAMASEFPHMASIGFNVSDDEIRWACGGTLISDQYVLTAGHCLRDSRSVASWVMLGITKLQGDNPSKPYRVVERIAHPDYKPPSLYNDIALLRLNSRVTFSLSVHPACLHTERVNAGLTCTATGWGVTNWENPAMSNDLLKVLLRVQEAAACSTAFNVLIRTGKKLMQGIRDESIICAGGGANDTCQGDSGSPIQVELDGDKQMYSVIGVTSFGAKACGNGSPALYSRVSHFVPWIVGIVWPPPKPSPSPLERISLKQRTRENNTGMWVFT